MIWKYPLSDICLGEEESQAVLEVLQSRWLTMGMVTQKFENEFAQYVNANHAVAVTNGTAALHLACIAIGLGPGDEVIAPSLSFVATANAIRYTGAAPIFADIVGENDFTISVEEIERLITPKTRAIMVMHYGGYACDMPAIIKIARERNLRIIEDAAHAVGSEINQQKMGTWGDIGCFSFFSNKNLATGEGGMLVTNNEEIYQKLILLRSHGMTSLTWDRYKGHASSYDVVDLGYNYRIDEIRSAIGLAQLRKLEENNAHRRKLVGLYREELAALTHGPSVPFENHPGITSAHIMPIILPVGVDREGFMQNMKSIGIQTSIHYPPIHKFSIYNNKQGDKKVELPVTEEVAAREVTLPLFPDLKDTDIPEIVKGVQASLE
jgi:dTDP-4-amino-4,6-dideoxygalactose transaminase